VEQDLFSSVDRHNRGTDGQRRAVQQWRHLEGLLDRSSGRAGLLAPPAPRDAVVRGSVACYPPVWGIDQPGGPVPESARPASLRTVLSTEAIATMLGTSALLYGDRVAALCDPYYPKHAKLSAGEAATVIAWRRFALRCRDLFLEGEAPAGMRSTTKTDRSLSRRRRLFGPNPSVGRYLPGSSTHRGE
jgi:hypothetical protein